MKYKNYFKNVVDKSNLLILGNDSLTQYETLFQNFNNFYFQELTSYTLENLTSRVIELNIDTILITNYSDGKLVYEAMLKLKKLKKIHLLVCLFKESLELNEELINIADNIFTDTISNEDLEYKFFSSLHDISTFDLSMESCSTETQRYKDAFDIEVMYISEELKTISEAFDSGDISQENFEKLKTNISKVTQIVNGHLMSSATIQNLINSFEEYLKTLELENLDISALDGFESLSRLVEDISVFLDKYFITKQIDDIYVVEDSLTNSFEYVKQVFSGKQDSLDDEDGSEMEFF